MSKHKPGKGPYKPTAPSSPPPKEAGKMKTESTASRSIINKLGAIVFLLGFALYFQTYQYDFTLDDRLVVFENKLTTQGISAIPEIFSKSYLSGSVIPDTKIYRPVSKAVFAICWSLSPNNPMLFHLVNIFLFALTGLLLFLTLVKYMPGNSLLPLIISLLFVAHPAHTEVVCSVKSLDEILSLLFFIVSLHFLHAYVQTKKSGQLGWAAMAFFFSFISKESGITYLAVFPMVALYLKAIKESIIRISGIMLFVVAVVFGIRMLILQGPDTNPLSVSDNILAGATDFLAQRATAIYLLGKYVLLLLFPHPLVCDYSTQQISLVSAGNMFFIAALLLLTASLVFAFWKLRHRDWLAFGILFFFITISVTSNIFFLGGTHFAERFLYAPSLGFCIVIGALLDRYVDARNKSAALTWPALRARPILTGIVVLIVLLYGFKTIRQGPVWKNNIALFEHGVKVSPKSYRMHLSLAQDLAETKHIQQFSPEIQVQLYERAIQEAKTSLLYYTDIDAYDIIGNIFYLTKRHDSALHYYLKGLKYEPDYEVLNFHAGKALDKLERYREAIPYLEKALRANPKNDGALYNLALSYTNMNEIDKGLEYFLQVIELRPNGPDAYHYAGLIYRAKGDLLKAEEFLKKAQALGGPRL